MQDVQNAGDSNFPFSKRKRQVRQAAEVDLSPQRGGQTCRVNVACQVRRGLVQVIGSHKKHNNASEGPQTQPQINILIEIKAYQRCGDVGIAIQS